MSQLTIVANFRAGIDYIEDVRAELVKLVEASRADAGCVTYDLHEDNDDPAHYLIYEIWESVELWKSHSESSSVASFRTAVDGLIIDYTVTQLTQIA